MTAVRVVLADDQEMVRAGLRMLIDFQPDLEVVGEAADGLEAVEVVTRLRPDVVLMDVRMPRCDGIEAARRVLATVPDVAVPLDPDGGCRFTHPASLPLPQARGHRDPPPSDQPGGRSIRGCSGTRPLRNAKATACTRSRRSSLVSIRER